MWAKHRPIIPYNENLVQKNGSDKDQTSEQLVTEAFIPCQRIDYPESLIWQVQIQEWFKMSNEDHAKFRQVGQHHLTNMKRRKSFMLLTE